MDQFSPDEKAILDSAWKALETAQANFEFVRAHLSQKYGLTPNDTIQRDGYVVRFGQPAPVMVPVFPQLAPMPRAEPAVYSAPNVEDEIVGVPV